MQKDEGSFPFKRLLSSTSQCILHPHLLLFRIWMKMNVMIVVLKCCILSGKSSRREEHTSWHNTFHKHCIQHLKSWYSKIAKRSVHLHFESGRICHTAHLSIIFVEFWQTNQWEWTGTDRLARFISPFLSISTGMKSSGREKGLGWDKSVNLLRSLILGCRSF